MVKPIAKAIVVTIAFIYVTALPNISVICFVFVHMIFMYALYVFVGLFTIIINGICQRIT